MEKFFAWPVLHYELESSLDHDDNQSVRSQGKCACVYVCRWVGWWGGGGGGGGGGCVCMWVGGEGEAGSTRAWVCR